jgi:hypothetical protein
VPPTGAVAPGNCVTVLLPVPPSDGVAAPIPSLVSTLTVPPLAVRLAESSTASTIATVAVLPLLPCDESGSFVAEVVPLTTTLTGVTSPGAAGFTGAVTLIGHVIVLLPEVAGKLVIGRAGEHAPVIVTDAPGVAVVTEQVGFDAADGPAFVQTRLPVTVAPGAIDAGKPVICEVMSAAVLSTVIVTSAVSHVAGVVAGTLHRRYGTV